MRTYLKDSNSKKIIFLMVLKTDHVTVATGKTLTVTVSKNGAAFGAGGGSVAELAGGAYAYTPSAGDVDTLGPILYRATATDCDDCFIEGVIVAYDPYTAKFGLNDLAAGAAMTLTAAYDKAKDDVLTPLAVVDGLIDTLIDRLTETRAGYLDAAISSRSSHDASAVKTAMEADGSVLNLLYELTQADVKLETATTPWTEKYYKKGTTTLLLTKVLYDKDGIGITDIGSYIGQRMNS